MIPRVRYSHSGRPTEHGSDPRACPATPASAKICPTRWPALLGQVALVTVAFFLLALWPRLSLPPRLVTADEDTWLGQTGNFAAGLADGSLERTYQRGHPGTTALWASLAGLGLERARRYEGTVAYNERVILRRAAAREPTFVEDLTAARRGHAVINAVLVTVIGLLAWRLLGLLAGGLAGVLLALDPFLVAHAQVIRMDSLQAGFLGIGLLSVLARWARDGHQAYLFLGGVAFGLAFLSKTSSGLVALPLLLCAGWQVAQRLRSGQRPAWALTHVGHDVGLLALLALATCLVMLPALWVAPAATISRMVDYALWNAGTPPESGNFFFGRPVLDPGPLFYPVALLFRITPVALAGLLGILVLSFARVYLPAGRRPIVIWLGITAACLALELSFAPKKADRYLLPVWPLLLVLAAVGLGLLARAARRQSGLVTGALGFLVVAQAVWLPPIAPYALTYFNPLFGGLAGARQVVLVGWGEGLESAADYLNGLPNSRESVATTLYAEPLRANLRGQSLPLTRYAEADFLVDYVNMEQRGLLPSDVQAYVERTQPVSTADLVGVRFAAVYPLPRPEFAASLRVDQYLLENDEDTRGGRFQVRVRWTPLVSAASGWRPRLELVDRAGRTVAVADAPAAAVQPGDQGSKPLTLQLPNERGTLSLALSVLADGGKLARPTSFPPWARAEGERLAFPSITVRVR